MRKAYIRTVAGIILIALSAGLLFWWETTGRDKMLTKSVWVAKHAVDAGENLSMSDFKKINVYSENVVKGAIFDKNFSISADDAALQFIPENAQITKKMIGKKTEIIPENKSIYEIKREWIKSMSSSLRKGDVIDIYDESGSEYFGTYTLAFVKDREYQEVSNPESPRKNERILDRQYSTGSVEHIEIIAFLEEYTNIFNQAEVNGKGLLIVQRRV